MTKDKNCVSTCPTQYYAGANSQCLACFETCGSCTSAAQNGCVTCASGLYLLSGYCYQNCPSKYFANGLVCSQCSSSCATCSNATTCDTCATGFFQNQQCLTTCPDGYFGNAISKQCTPCNAACTTCTGSKITQCGGCQDGFLLS